MSAGGQQPNSSDNSMAIIWIIVAVFAGLGIIWYSAKEYIAGFYIKLKLIEISLLSYFTDSLEGTRTVILSTPIANYTVHDLTMVGFAVGNYLRYPLVILLFILSFVVYFTNTTRVYKRTYSMKDLVQLEKENWPQIAPVAGLDLIRSDIDKGPWAMAMTPMQFCKRNKLLEEFKRQPTEGMTKAEWGRIDVRLKRGQANKVFVMQLGPTWQGVDKLPPHTRALFAAFAARMNADTKAAADLLGKLSSTSTSKPDYSGVDELLKKHLNTKLVQNAVQSHAYVLTVMATMLEEARKDGVQGTADFLWIKPIDRRLWYVLNTVGRQTPFVEVAGIFAHWISEKELGKKMLLPSIEEATNALELSLKEIIYQPDEES